MLDYRWRTENVHRDQSKMVVAVRETLRKHLVSGTAVSGEKRTRDAFLDLEYEPGLEDPLVGAEVQA